MGDELSGPTGSLLPIAAGGDDPSVQALKSDIRNLRGSTALVERLSDWASGDASHVSSSSEWQPRRLGANPPAGVVAIAERAALEVYGACGVPPALFGARSDGTGLRESYRILLHTTLAPLVRIVESELTAKLGGEVKLSLDSIGAADLSGRARAFQSLVGGGMPVEKAAALAGLLESED